MRWPTRMNVEKAIEEYQKNETTGLCRFFDMCGSDKGTSWHQYSRMYDALFHGLCGEAFNLFELGIGTNNVEVESNMGEHGNPGASLYGWNKYFPKADLYGADIDRGCLFEHMQKRIQTFYCDQTDPESIAALWLELAGKKFKIIIEDGLHTPAANRCFLENSLHMLDDGGIYIVEDIDAKHVDEFNELLHGWRQRFTGYTFWFLEIKTVNTEPADNWMVIVQKALAACPE